MTASETVNPKEKLGGPLGRAEERHRPGSMGATSPPRPHPAPAPAPLLFLGQFGPGWGRG